MRMLTTHRLDLEVLCIGRDEGAFGVAWLEVLDTNNEPVKLPISEEAWVEFEKMARAGFIALDGIDVLLRFDHERPDDFSMSATVKEPTP